MTVLQGYFTDLDKLQSAYAKCALSTDVITSNIQRLQDKATELKGKRKKKY